MRKQRDSMNPELTLDDLEQYQEDCIVHSEADLKAVTQIEEAQIENRMLLRFVKTFV